MRLIVRLLASLALLFGPFGLLPARDTKEPDEKGKKVEKKKEGPAPLTHKSLLEMIEKLGYEPKVLGKDKTGYQISTTSEGFTATFTIELSKDSKRLWIAANFRKLVEVDAIPAKALLKLLAWNREIGPFHFTLDEKLMRYYLQLSAPNEGIDSAFLSEWIETMAANLKRTAPDWQYEVLQPPRPVVDGPEASKERKKFLGTWVVHSLEQDGTTKPADDYKGYTYAFEGTTCEYGNKIKKKFLLAIDPGKTPGQVDFRIDLGLTELCIYKVEDDTLTLCVDSSGKKRPTKFEAPKGATAFVVALKRQKP